MNNKRNRGGRNPKLDPAINRYSINFSSEEDVTFDKSQHEYYAKLSDFHAQFRMVGNNYNQTLKELKCHVSERRAMALVCKLEKCMIQLVQIMHKVKDLTDKYQEKSAEKWGK